MAKPEFNTASVITYHWRFLLLRFDIGLFDWTPFCRIKIAHSTQICPFGVIGVRPKGESTSTNLKGPVADVAPLIKVSSACPIPSTMRIPSRDAHSRWARGTRGSLDAMPREPSPYRPIAV